MKRVRHELYLEGVEHSFAGDDDLLGLLLQRKRTNEGRYLLGGLPLRKLPEALLTCTTEMRGEAGRGGGGEELRRKKGGNVIRTLYSTLLRSSVLYHTVLN